MLVVNLDMLQKRIRYKTMHTMMTGPIIPSLTECTYIGQIPVMEDHLEFKYFSIRTSGG